MEKGSNPVTNRVPILPPRKNDSECWNCSGVSYFSDELRKAGKRPICYGIEYKSAKNIDIEKMKILESHPPIEENTEVWVLGFSQSSSRMHRMGQVPVVSFGVKLMMINGIEDKPKITPSQTPSSSKVNSTTEIETNNETATQKSTDQHANNQVDKSKVKQTGVSRIIYIYQRAFQKMYKFSETPDFGKKFMNHSFSITSEFFKLGYFGITHLDQIGGRLVKFVSSAFDISKKN